MMLPTNRIPTHPGEILVAEFIEPMNLTQEALAEHLDIPIQKINEIVLGKRGITPTIAWLLAGAFSTSPQFWMNLQINYDLAVSRPSQFCQPIAS